MNVYLPYINDLCLLYRPSLVASRSIVLLATRGQPVNTASVAQYLVLLGSVKVPDLQNKGTALSSLCSFYAAEGICLLMSLTVLLQRPFLFLGSSAMEIFHHSHGLLCWHAGVERCWAYKKGSFPCLWRNTLVRLKKSLPSSWM